MIPGRPQAGFAVWAAACLRKPTIPLPNRWLFRIPFWVTPTVEWQTYLVIYESPPFPARTIDRNLVIDTSGTDQVWVDDVALFVWQPGSKP